MATVEHKGKSYEVDEDGFLLKGNQPDEERGARVVLDEFRAGKLGRITLESAPEAEV